MMAQIYGEAKNVCVWIGSGDKESKIALDFIKNEVLRLQDFDDLCENQNASHKWRAMLDVMKRPWFSRRWVRFPWIQYLPETCANYTQYVEGRARNRSCK